MTSSTRSGRRLIQFAAGVIAILAFAATPLKLASADDDNDQGDRGWHHGWYGGPAFGVYAAPGYYYAPPPAYYAPPPVYYAPPPAYYAPPPPVYYAPPSVSFGINIPFRNGD